MLKSFKCKICSSFNGSSCSCYSDARQAKNSYDQFLRKKYFIPSDCQVIVKQGFVCNNDIKVAKSTSSYNESLKIRQTVYDDIRNGIEKIKGLIDSAKDEIKDLIKFKNSFQIKNNLDLHMQIELVVENLFAKISKPLYALSQTACKRFIVRLNENGSEFKEDLTPSI